MICQNTKTEWTLHLWKGPFFTRCKILMHLASQHSDHLESTAAAIKHAEWMESDISNQVSIRQFKGNFKKKTNNKKPQFLKQSLHSLECFCVFKLAQLNDVQMENYLKTWKQKICRYTHSLCKHLKQSWEANWWRGQRGSCVFLVEERSFRALMPVGTPAALVLLYGTL